MKKIEAIVRPDRLEEVKEGLGRQDVKGLTISQVVGCGHQKGLKNYYRGAPVDLNLLPKVKIEIVCENEKAEEIVSSIAEAAKTGEIGDGKIFIYNIEDTMRIRTGESGEKAI
jgi:nitrogen regulatory protein P-II 1